MKEEVRSKAITKDWGRDIILSDQATAWIKGCEGWIWSINCM